MAESDGSLVPERILELSERLSSVAGAKIGEISSINREAKMLAINALKTGCKQGGVHSERTTYCDKADTSSGRVSCVREAGASLRPASTARP